MAKRVAINPKGTFLEEGLLQKIEKMYEGSYGHILKEGVLKQLQNTIVPFVDRLKELKKMDKEKRGMPMAIAVEFQSILKFIKALDSKKGKETEKNG